MSSTLFRRGVRRAVVASAIVVPTAAAIFGVAGTSDSASAATHLRPAASTATVMGATTSASEAATTSAKANAAAHPHRAAFYKVTRIEFKQGRHWYVVGAHKNRNVLVLDGEPIQLR